MLTSIRYVLLCALRDRLFFGLIVGVVVAAGISAMLGGTAFLEEKEMSLAYASAASRLILVVGLIVFTCFHIRSAFDSREIDVMLSRPLSRTKLVLAYWLGFAAVGSLLVLPTAGIIFFTGPMSMPGFVGWTLSLLIETWLVVAMALFAALAMKSAVSSVMVTLGFYLLSRMMAFFVMTADSFIKPENYLIISKMILKAVSILVPRLDFFSKSEWLIYGTNGTYEWILFLAQGSIFIPIIVLCCIIDFRKKQF